MTRIDQPVPVRRASQITPRAYDWLWQWRLAFGKLSMLAGDARGGKSLVALAPCARLSTGRPLPHGRAGPRVATSLIIQDEGGGDDTVIIHLHTPGADL